MRWWFILLFSSFVILQNNSPIEVGLGETRDVPLFGFNGNTVRGPSWINAEFTDSVATMKPHVLRYPAGLGSYWDWSTGWFLENPIVNDSIIIDPLPNNWSNLDSIDIRPIQFQNACNEIGANGIFVINMLTSDYVTMTTSVQEAIQDGVTINLIELDSEMNHDNDYKIAKYPTAGDYARDCQVYINSLRTIIPNAQFSLVAGNRSSSTDGRATHWNDSLYAFVDNDSFDALVWHQYLYMNDSTHAEYSDRKFISYPFFDIPRYENWKGFQETEPQIQNHEIWVTEYNLHDKSEDHIYQNTWLHALFLSTFTEVLLNNNLITMLLAHNVGGPTGFDGIDNDENSHFPKKATGFFGMLINLVSHNMDYMQKFSFPSSLTDTITYTSSNNNNHFIDCPRLFGWKFNNISNETGIISNVSDSSIVISVDNIFDTELLWTHWTADTLRGEIQGYESTNRVYDIGHENILIPPFSLNTAETVILGDVNQDSILNILDIIEVVDFILGNSNFTEKQMLIGDVLQDGTINVSDILIIIENILS